MSQTFYIRVVVDPRGAQQGGAQVERSLDRVSKKAEKTMSLMRQVFIAREVVNAAQTVASFADAYTDLENRVKSVTTSQAEFEFLMDQIPTVAKRSRASIEDVGKAYQAMAGATANMGLSAETVLRITETLQKSMIVSGATTAEAASTMTQFGQALRKGKLDGDEMRSVMENNVIVQRALAAQLGVSTDDLLKLSKAGKITRDVMVQGLLAAAGEVDAKFSQTTPKMADAWTQAKNELILLAGEFNKTVNVGAAVAKFFEVLIEHLRTITGLVADAVAGFGSLYTQLSNLTGLEFDASTLVDYVSGVAASTNPIAAAIWVRNQTKKVKGPDQLIAGNAVAGLVDPNMQRFLGITDDFAQEPEKVQIGSWDYGYLGANIQGNIQDQFAFQDKILAAARAHHKSKMDKWMKGPKGEEDKFPDQFKGFMEGVYPAIKAQNDLMEGANILEQAVRRKMLTDEQATKILGDYAKQHEDALLPVQAYIKGLKEEAANAFLRTQFTDEAAFEAELEYRRQATEFQKYGLELSREEYMAAVKQLDLANKVAEATRKMDEERAAFLEGLGVVSHDEQYDREWAKLMRSTGVTFGPGATNTPEQLAAYQAGIEELRRRDAAGEFTPRILSESDKYVAEMTKLREAFDANEISADDFYVALHKIDEQFGLVYEKTVAMRDVQTGFAEGWRQVTEQMSDMATTVSQEVVAAFNRMSDALVEFVVTGKFNWESFVMSLLQGMARIATQYLLMKILGIFAGGAAGGGGVGLIGDGLMQPTFAARGLDGVVQGRSGTDTNFLPLMVTNGERVTVTPAGQESRVTGGASVKVVNIYESRGAQLALMQSPASEKSVINHLRRNPELARSLR